MKRIQILAILALIAASLAAQAQTTTNVTVRWTVETVTANVTNSVNTSLRLDYGTRTKDSIRIDGLSFAYANYLATLSTNDVPLAFGPYMKAYYTTIIDSYAKQKQAGDNAAMAAKITQLLTQQSDLLSNADLNNLATIAAKAP